MPEDCAGFTGGDGTLGIAAFFWSAATMLSDSRHGFVRACVAKESRFRSTRATDPLMAIVKHRRALLRRPMRARRLHGAIWLLAAVLLAALPARIASGAPFSSSSIFPTRPQTPHPAVCRVLATEMNAVSMGSGTLVEVRDDVGLVVTNWHVVRDAPTNVSVVFPDGFQSTAHVLKMDQNWDLAALLIRRPHVQPMKLSTTAPQPGDPLTIAGYGSGEFRAAAGRCTGYASPGSSFPQHFIEVSVAARQGDSGGPIVNERGELAGVLFGASRRSTTGSYVGRVRWFLSSVSPALEQPAATPSNEAIVSAPS